MSRWHRLFPERVFDRVEIYYGNDMVENIQLAQDQEHFTAQVQGGMGRSYTVTGRLRLDGRASELDCNCPWANKGHRCKHEVAALLAVENEQENEHNVKVPFADLISEHLKQMIAHKSPVLNPLNLIGNMKFTKKSYDQALELNDHWSISSCRHFDDKMRKYEYFWEIVTEDNELITLSVQFTRWQIISIKFDSDFSRIEKDSVRILALFYFINEYLDDDPFDLTNQAAEDLLEFYSDASTQNDEPIILRASIDKYNNIPSLTFKLGKNKHLYKVKDLNQLVDASRHSSSLKLGKFFNEPINQAKMDIDSQHWLSFIEKIIDARNLNEEFYYNYSSQVGRITLENSVADEVNDLLYQGVKLYSNEQPIGYTTDQLDLNIKIETQKSSALVSVEDLPVSTIITGSHAYYGYYKDVWIKYIGLTPASLHNLGLQPGAEMQFSKKTVAKFAHNILPKFEQTKFILVSGTDELKAILPPEAHFLFKLDYRVGSILCVARVQYGDAQYELNQGYTEEDRRDVEKETAAWKHINTYFSDYQHGRYVLSNEDSDVVQAFLDDGINELKRLGEVQITANFRSLLKGIKINLDVGVGINLTNELLDIDLADQKMSWEDIQAALKAYQEKRKYFVLKNGMLAKAEQPTIEQLAQTLHDLGISFKDFIHGKLHLPAYRAFYFAKQMKAANALHFSTNESFNTLINDLAKNQLKQNQIPVSLQNILRPYQKIGFNWLSTIVNYKFGGLLADEMGLGKTLQIISLLLARKEKMQNQLPSLIVAPASVIYNWQAEVKKFAPSLNVALLDGTKKERERLLLDAKKYNLLISSYQSLNRDLEAYQNLIFDVEVIDEAQNIKNQQSVTAKTVKVIKAHHKLALTGTPIENKLSELWSIFDYLMPGFLGLYPDFRKKYELPIVKEQDKEAEDQLANMIIPFILRRLKKDVLRDLPDKDEEIVPVKMNKKQADLYNMQTQKIIAQLNGQGDEDFKRSRFQILAQITKLREICCDPHLLYENYHGKSNKLIATIELIKNNLANGHKILLFSQFTAMLDILHENLARLRLPLFTITGSTPKTKRQEQVQKFNQMAQPGVFLISLKAGGTGINLTGADVVIHYDPWWNLAAEKQATDRAHRIGQKHSVKIYKMVTEDSIEERIIALQQKKAELADIILQNDQIADATMSKDDLIKILK
ncbi:SNF2 family N-terminal domain protein [Lactobacillus crispatus 214-1]|uniref:DEAD/DEAH box helicase n=1 Tax=Lactobacillus crispatus TaxID=47770 RepID=UPI0001CA7B55|nr:DEAD/DEAH box helicase [Lactobacillus crispatus]EFD99789.1 SNF2 family N-terminal domain protein [Lactobacillus crispatus 214-1]MBO4167127.1 SNF2 helicase associated domain-containing protein [Lactobacillus crispatus]